MSNKKLKLNFENNGHLAHGNGRLDGLFEQITRRKMPRLYHGPRAKTEGQRHYMEEIEDNDIIFATGPAGSGKTHLAVGMAVQGLKDEEFKKILAVRPIVGVGGTGKTMGYLPGGIEDKVAPYLRPIFDELKKFFSVEEIEQLQKMDILEMGSLEHMRGRTLEDTFIIVDEAQNCVDEEMPTILTRLGMGSKMVLNGDISRYKNDHSKSGQYQQCDLHLPPDEIGAFEYQTRNLAELDDIAVVHLKSIDVVRHPLVKRMTEHGL